MPISTSHSFIFVHIPKTAGSSVARMIAPYCVAQDRNNFLRRISSHLPVREDPNLLHTRKHDSAAWLRSKLGADVFSDFFKFAVVRDPYTRAISEYEYIRQTSSHHRQAKVARMSFSDFLDFKDREKGTQAKMLCDSSGKILVDHFVRFETLHADISQVFDKIGVEERLGTKVSHSSQKQPLDTYLTDPTIRRINEVFSVDFDLLGYEKR